MKRMRILGLCLVAVFAFAAVAAASASAAPEWAACQKAAVKNTGNYTDKLCTVASEPGKGKYELVIPSIGKGKGFKSKGVGESTLHTVVPGNGDLPVTCKKFKASGKAGLPNKEEAVVAEFSKCTALGGAVSCGNVGAGKITTEKMAGELGTIHPAEGGGTGVSLHAEGATPVVTFTCTGVAEVRVQGTAIGVQTGDINAISKTSTTTYTVQEDPLVGEQEVEECENIATKKVEKNCKWFPLTNPAVFIEKGFVGFLESEFNQGKGFSPGIPAGQEGVSSNKGEALMVHL